jgi:hypothetical protein
MGVATRSRSWDEIVSSYRHLSDDHGWRLGPMMELVDFVASSPYATALFPTTSHDRLCIARTRVIRWNHQMLTVRFDPNAERFLFEYWEASAWCREPWRTSSAAEEGITKLEHVMKRRLGWFR